MLKLRMPNSDWEHIALNETDSTMLYLRQPFEMTKDFILVTAEHQTAGRGQRGTKWESEKAKNLLFGLLLHPTFITPDLQFRLSEVTALAIAFSLSTFISHVKVKWPNDIYYCDKKICGMLLEHDISEGRISSTIIGPGININQSSFKSNAPNPVSLKQILKHETDREAVMNLFIDNFNQLYTSLSKGKGEEIDQLYFDNLYRADGQFYSFIDCNETFQARIASVETNGRLVLIDQNNQTRKYAFKEVKHQISQHIL